MPLETALQVHQGLLAGLPLRRLFLIVARRAQEVVGASLVAICTPTEDGTGHAVRSAVGRGSASLRGWTIPVDSGDLGAVLRSRQSTVLALDTGTWPPYLPSGLAGQLGSTLLVPAAAQERTLGFMLLANPAGGRAFTDRDRAVAELLASQAAVAIEYQRARAAMAHIGLVEDLERIEGELFDGVAQTLYGVGLSLETALPLAEQPSLRTQLERAIGDIDEAVAQLRGHIGGVRPTIVPDRGLELALRRVATQFAHRTQMAIQVEVDEAAATRLAEHGEQLLLIVSERLTELARRPDIANCRVSIYRQEELAVLELADDGRGVHAEDEHLRALQELVADLAIEVAIESTPELGATLRATVPE
ncbi:MAG: GAF domain-containing protein [Candidatus Dormibacteraeota bacterium]|nr:GAF domain-containing protein [Candidatus Dormibacteraeota bacterium]